MKRFLMICAAAMFAITPIGVMAQAKTPAAAEKPAKTLTTTGKVAAVAADSLTVTASSGDMTFTIDSKTKIVGKGIGTKSGALKTDGKSTPATEFVHVGDRVTVKYHDMGATKHAANVHVLTPQPAK